MAANRVFSLPSTKEYNRVNTTDKKILVKRDGYTAWENNPHYKPDADQVRQVARMLKVDPELKTPPLYDRIKAALECYESVNEDSLMVVTDMPTDNVRGVIVPADAQRAPQSGVVILLGSESRERGPRGICEGRRVTWTMMGGTGYEFARNWEMRVLRFSEIKTVMIDRGGEAPFRKAYHKVFGKKWKESK